MAALPFSFYVGQKVVHDGVVWKVSERGYGEDGRTRKYLLKVVKSEGALAKKYPANKKYPIGTTIWIEEGALDDQPRE